MLMQKQNTHTVTAIPLDDWDRYYYTNDFDLSVTLLCKGFELAGIDAEQSGKKIFIFKKVKGIGAVIDGFWGNDVLVRPLEYANARKNLKSRLYAMTKQY